MQEENKTPAVIEVKETEVLTPEILNKKIIIDGVEHEIVQKTDLEALVVLVEETEKERKLMEFGIYQICGVLGLTNEERTEIKPEVLNEEESVFKNLMSSGMNLFSLFSKSNFPGRMGKNAQDKIKEQFGFIEKLLPLLKKRS